ncbi:hypothetical protein ACN469_24240 [Corallococcus terminator]
MKRGGSGPVWAVLSCLLLGACGVESLEDASSGDEAALPLRSSEASLTWDPYADAVASGTTVTVLNASAALGAPDGHAATLLSLLNTALVLDLGAGEEGTGDLRVHYQGLSLALLEGDGPENIFWASDRTPPSGTYDICLIASSFAPDISPADPVSYTIKVRVPGQPDQDFSGAYTSDVITMECTPEEASYVGSITYP